MGNKQAKRRDLSDRQPDTHKIYLTAVASAWNDLYLTFTITYDAVDSHGIRSNSNVVFAQRLADPPGNAPTLLT
jgi:hypothetical protein